ncbi:MAG: O-antigen ligase family protein, partial [Chloroflexota bacterium]|nr:O-antigen ligase family protein [Chloroflexota bacterium]
MEDPSGRGSSRALIRGRIADPRLLPWIAALLFFVLLGGTELAVTGTLLRALDALLGGVLIWIWVHGLRIDADRLDRLALLALIGFLLACAVSSVPRASFDAGVAATAYVAAFYFARRILARSDARAMLLGILAGLSLGVSVSFTLAWSLTWLDWLRLTDFRTLPLTDLPLRAAAYRHPQVIGMLVALLLPAPLVVLRAGPAAARILAALAVVCSLAVVVVSGSRTTWLAAVVALAVPAALAIRARVERPRVGWRAVTVVIVAGLVIGGALVVWSPGAVGGVVERLTDTATLGARGRIWGSSLGTWLDHPLTGSGPGTFVISLGTSGFYDESPFTPRHADNALIQLLGEGGALATVLVLVACGGWVAAVFRAPATAGSLGAAWAVTLFLLASLGDNPTDTAYLVGILVVWAAFAAPGRAGGSAVARGRLAPGHGASRVTRALGVASV